MSCSRTPPIRKTQTADQYYVAANRYRVASPTPRSREIAARTPLQPVTRQARNSSTGINIELTLYDLNMTLTSSTAIIAALVILFLGSAAGFFSLCYHRQYGNAKDDGTSLQRGNLEARVTSLEADMREIRSQISMLEDVFPEGGMDVADSATG